MITLSIIGIVAALTIPNLVQNIQERDWNTSATVFEKKLEQALKIMNSQGVLSGYRTTEEFVNELEKHFKIMKVCKNTNLIGCFNQTVTFGESPTDISDIQYSSQLAIDDWGTTTVGVQFGGGVTGIMAYNPSCTENPNSNEVPVMDCLALLYDTTGNTKPNKLSKDVRATANVRADLATGCLFKIAGVCVTKTPFKPLPLTAEECEDMLATGAYGGGFTCGTAQTNYYAGAVKACGGVRNLPTTAQLTAIARTLYGDDSISDGDSTGLTLNTQLVSEYGLPSGDFVLWSGTTSTNAAYPSASRKFSSTSTTTKVVNVEHIATSSNPYAMCVGK